MSFFAKNIKFLRNKKGMNQTEVASSIGFKQSAWSGYESGASTPNFKDLMRIIEYFGITASELLDYDLSNVHLNTKEEVLKNAENVHLNVHPNVHLNEQKGQNMPNTNAGLNDSYIAVKDQLIRSKDDLIDTLKHQIKYLQNQLDQMKYETQERKQTQYTPSKEAKSA